MRGKSGEQATAIASTMLTVSSVGRGGDLRILAVSNVGHFTCLTEYWL